MKTSNTETPFPMKQVEHDGSLYTVPYWMSVMDIDGVGYEVHQDADEEAVRALHIMRGDNSPRVTLIFGDIKTGLVMGKPLSGYISRSVGPLFIPIIRWNRRTFGGPRIDTGSLLAIRFANKKDGGWMYRHPNYKGEG